MQRALSKQQAAVQAAAAANHAACQENLRHEREQAQQASLRGGMPIGSMSSGAAAQAGVVLVARDRHCLLAA